MKTYKFEKLSRRSKDKAIKDYCKGWLETHPNDPLDEYEVEGILLHDLEEERYTKKGELIEDELCY